MAKTKEDNELPFLGKMLIVMLIMNQNDNVLHKPLAFFNELCHSILYMVAMLKLI